MTREEKIQAGSLQLAATLHLDEDTEPSDIMVLLNSAMGMPRDFYAPFANWLASQGVVALTWDYRGVGDSACAGETHIHDWGESDLPAVIEWLRERYPQRRLVIVAHSVGGQILGMNIATNRAERLVLIGSQSGYWRLWSGWQQLRIAFIWFCIIPLVARLFDVFPGRWFGLQVDLPNGVARQWARWGRDPEYLMGKHRRASAMNYANINRPLLNVWINDDDIASYAANRKMLTWYSRAQVRNWNLHPADLGVERIGHFRLFRETVGRKFWPRLLAWIKKQ